MMNIVDNRPLLAGNWKMNLSPLSGREFAQTLVRELPSFEAKAQVWIAPPFLSIPAVVDAVKGTTIQVGGQNVHWEDKGAFTGEVSPSMLREAGCSFAIVGHSERRQLFRETSEDVARRMSGALRGGLTPIVCVGETLEERESGLIESVLSSQLSPVITTLSQLDTYSAVVIAYEPVWAIGTGKTATPEQAAEVHQMIQEHWRANSTLQCPPILYGGSVTPENIVTLLRVPLIAGALIGGASISTEKFRQIVELSCSL